MGMYDDVTCEHALPGEPKPKDNHFQTKDFDRLMDHYTITADDRLLKEKAEVQLHGMLNFYTYTNEVSPTNLHPSDHLHIYFPGVVGRGTSRASLKLKPPQKPGMEIL